MLHFCATCIRHITLDEIRDGEHDGHAFNQFQAGSLALLRLYVQCERCPRKETCETASQPKAEAAKYAP
jgi:hypothetical protein